MNRASGWGALAAVVVLAVTGCTSDATTTSTRADSLPETTQTTRSPAVQLSAEPADALRQATQALVEAGSYSFTASVRVGSTDGPTQTLLTGWVDGADRLLTVELDGRQQTTYVTNGTAVVERDGTTSPIALVDAGSAPSLSLLDEVEGLRRVDDLTLRGVLPAAKLGRSGFELEGEAQINVRLDSGGSLVGYDLVAGDQSWSVSVDFSEVGLAFSR